MNTEALFCDGTGEYVKPAQPEQGERVKLRFRTAKDDVDEVTLLSGDGTWDMEKADSQGLFDYYETERQMGEEPFSYCFMIRSGDESCIYNRTGVCRDRQSDANYNFCIVPGFSVPKWAEGAVMYQIYTDRFRNGDPANDVVSGEYLYLGAPTRRIKDWDQLPSANDVQEFYGGDIKGVLEKLDYLQDLGVEVLYFNPLFVSPSNHKYDTQDYDHIDPHFTVIPDDGGEILSALDEADAQDAPGGDFLTALPMASEKYKKRTTALENLEASDAFFAQFVEEVHRRGMKIILDGVFNHCGSFNKWMDRERVYEGQPGYAPGAYHTWESPYRDYFRFRNQDRSAWPYNDSYEGWWGYETLPKLNYEGAKELEDYILSVAKKWVSPPYNADGWRLDVAADLGHSAQYNHEFWRKFRQAVKEANPDAIILAEHYGSARDWLGGDQWDTVMNYDAFMEPVTFFLTGMEKHSDAIRPEMIGDGRAFMDSMRQHMADFLTPSLYVAMNELSNHDHSRFLTRTNGVVGRVDTLGPQAAEEGVKPAVMRQAVVMQMTWPGAPTVYYGDEAGLCGFTDPDNRRTYPWGREDEEMLSFHKEAISIHKNSRALKSGSLYPLLWEQDLVAYARVSGEERVVVIIHTGDYEQQVLIPVWIAEIPAEGQMQIRLYSDKNGYNTTKGICAVQNGELQIQMGPDSAMVLQ